jgi:hypothetical protein
MQLASTDAQSSTLDALLAESISAVDPNVSERASRASRARHASNRRPRIDPTTCERDYSTAEVEFMQAMQAYKMASGRMFPTWSEVLEVLQGLGYKK